MMISDEARVVHKRLKSCPRQTAELVEACRWIDKLANVIKSYEDKTTAKRREPKHRKQCKYCAHFADHKELSPFSGRKVYANNCDCKEYMRGGKPRSVAPSDQPCKFYLEAQS